MYLGIIFDFNMKWDAHIQYIINKTEYLIYIFAKIKKYLDTNSLTVIYYAFFHSYINYGIIAWGGVYKDNMTRLQNIQTRILKIIQKNCFVKNSQLNVRQVFTLEALMYHYEELEIRVFNSQKQKRLLAIKIAT